MLHTEISTPTVDILGVPISRLGLDKAIQFSAKHAKNRAGGYVCFANVHTVTEAHNLPEVKRAMTEATLTVADGTPLVWISKLGPHPIESRVCGPDFMTHFLQQHPNLRHAFIGGIPGLASELAARYAPGSTCYSPPMRKFSPDTAIEDWKTFLSLSNNNPSPDVVWVGLGAPKQELWMHSVSSIAPDTLFFGVGAAFDFLTETKKRAPLWMQKSGLEWLFRLLQEPKRLWKRYLVTNISFITLIFLEKIGLRRS